MRGSCKESGKIYLQLSTFQDFFVSFQAAAEGARHATGIGAEGAASKI